MKKLYLFILIIIFVCSFGMARRHRTFNQNKFKSYRDSILHITKQYAYSHNIDSIVVFINIDNPNSGIHIDSQCPSLKVGRISSYYLSEIDKYIKLCPYCNSKHPYIKAVIDSIFRKADR